MAAWIGATAVAGWVGAREQGRVDVDTQKGSE